MIQRDIYISKHYSCEFQCSISIFYNQLYYNTVCNLTQTRGRILLLDQVAVTRQKVDLSTLLLCLWQTGLVGQVCFTYVTGLNVARCNMHMMKQKTYQHPFDCILIGTSLNMKILCDSGCEHIVKNYDTKYQCIPYKVYNQ